MCGVQIARLERGLYDMKMAFNEQFLALRDVKRSVVARLRTVYSQLNAISVELGGAEPRALPQMAPEEEPERRDEVSEADIDAHLAQQEADAVAAASKAAGDGLGGFGAAAAAPRPAAGGAAASAASAAQGNGGEVSAAGAGQRVPASMPLSPLEQAERTIRARELVCNRCKHTQHGLPIYCCSGVALLCEFQESTTDSHIFQGHTVASCVATTSMHTCSAGRASLWRGLTVWSC